MPPNDHDATDRTAALTEIWREVLASPGLDEDSDLFDNGGTSLHVLRIVGRIYDVLAADVKLRDVFTHSSPRNMADFMADVPGRTATSS